MWTLRRGSAVVVALVGGLLAFACDESPVAPDRESETSAPVPNFALLLDSAGAPRGPLLTEVTIEVPDSGANSGTQTLWGVGQIQTPAVVELVGGIDLENRHIPGSAILTEGFVLYYRQDGELMFRFVSMAFYALPPAGGQQWQQPPVAEASDSLVMVDSDAANHGLQVYWSVEAPEPVGYNFNDGGDPPPCPLMISFLCYPAPNPDPEHISATPPQGTIRVRAFSADTAAVAITVRIDTVIVANGTSFTTKRGEDSVTVRASVTGPAPTDSIRWMVRDAAGDSVQAIAPAPENLGRGPELTWVVPAQDTSRWPTVHPGTLAQKSLAFEMVAQVTDSAGAVRDSAAVVARQDEIDTMREEYVEFSHLRGVPRRQEFERHQPCTIVCINNGHYAFAIVNPGFADSLTGLQTAWGDPATWQVNVIYRNPVHNRRHVPGRDLDSFHQDGCAADLQTFPVPRNSPADNQFALDFWTRLRDLAVGRGFETEALGTIIRAANGDIIGTRGGSGLGHVHVELDPCQIGIPR
jgi:hypothetical protein